MGSTFKRVAGVLGLGMLLAGCSEFTVNCSTPKGNYLLMVKTGPSWLPVFGPAARWVTPAEIYDLVVLRADEYQVRAELRNRLAGWPSEAQRQTFVVNRITSEFQTAFRSTPGRDRDGATPDGDAALDAVGGTCSRVFPQRL